MTENKCINYGYWGGTKRIDSETETERIKGYKQRVVNRCALDGKRCHQTKCEGYEEV